MLGDIAAWWTQHHSQYTVPDLTELPIFTAFLEEQGNYDRTVQGKRETMVGEQEDRVLTWDWGTERETLRKVKGNWAYQRRFREAAADLSITAGSSASEEWGEVEISLSEDCKSYERWRLSPQSRLYERFSLRGFTKRGTKSSESIHFSGNLELSNETYSESPSDSHSERIWQRGDLRGSDKTHQEGGFSYGESHVDSVDFSEAKSWHRDSEHYWGSIQGKAEGKAWSERWDIGGNTHFEERLMEDQGRKSGMRHERQGKDWKRHEWEGLETSEHEGKGNTEEIGQIQQFLEELKTIGLTEMLNSEEVVKKLQAITPVSYSLDAEFLLNERQRLLSAQGSDLQTLMQQIRAIHALVAKQEALKGKMMEEFATPEANLNPLKGLLEELMESSNKTSELMGVLEAKGKKEGELMRGKSKNDAEICEMMLKQLLKLESIKCENVKTALNREKSDQIAEIQAEVASLCAEQDSINASLQHLLPTGASIPSIPASTAPPNGLKAKQALTTALVALLEQSSTAEEGWEGFEAEGMDQGLAEVRSKLSSLVQPLEKSHPELMGEVAALSGHSLTPQRLLSVVQLITQAVSSTAGKPGLPAAAPGLLSLFKPQSHTEEEEYEETVEEVVEVTVDEQIQEMVMKVEDLEQRLNAQDDQITGLKRQLTTKERISQALSEELADFRRSATLYEAREEEISNLTISLRQCKVALSDKTLELQLLQSTCSQLEADAKRANSLQLKLATLEQQYAALEGTLEALQHASLHSPSESTAQLSALREAAKASEQQLKEYADRIASLAVSNKKEHEKRNKQLLLRLIVAISGILRTEKTSVFLVWKVRSEAPISDWDYREMRDRPELRAEWSDGGETEEKWGSEAYLVLRKRCFDDNPLVMRLNQGQICTNSLMELVEMYEFMENVMDRKVIEDNIALEQGKQPLSVSTFLLAAVMSQSEGNKHVADDFLSRFLSTLYAQYRLATPMAVLYARLLGLFSPFPVLLPASVLLLRFNSSFNDLAKVHSLPQIRNTPAFCGKALPLPLLFSSFATQLTDDSISFEHFLTELKPKYASAEEYVCDMIRYQAKKKLQTENAYIMQQFAGKETISEQEFTEKAAKLGFSRAISVEAFREINAGETLKPAKLAEKVQAIVEKHPTGLAVTKGAFLSAILAGYETALRQLTTNIVQKLPKPLSEPYPSEDSFRQAILMVRPGLGQETAGKLFTEVSKWTEEGTVTHVHLVGALALYDTEFSSPFRFSPFPLAEKGSSGGKDQTESPVLPSARIRSPVKLRSSRSLVP